MNTNSAEPDDYRESLADGPVVLRAGPGPEPGLGREDFTRICVNGFGDGHNSFPHSIAWFGGRLLVGTTRSNFLMVKVHDTFKGLPVDLWPVEGPDDVDGLYRELDRRAQIWSYDPHGEQWEQVFVAPEVTGLNNGPQVARETGYRCMHVFKGTSDAAPALYTASWAVSRSPGALLLRSENGRDFSPVSPFGIIDGLPITATRVLTEFRGRLFTSPTGVRGHGVDFVINVSGMPVIYASEDPANGGWTPVCEPGFGNPDNEGVFVLAVFGNRLYAGTFNNHGFEIWCSDCEGKPPFAWTKVIDRGAGRGSENQVAATMRVFKGNLYVGTAIQNGGNDLSNKIGPAGSEILRIHPDHSWDLVVGQTRSDREHSRSPISGLPAGFGNVFNGYIWSMQEHDGWLYVGTMNSTIWVRFLNADAYSEPVRKILDQVGPENIVEHEAGCTLWRSADGENWLPVTKTGFDNPYNLGVRNMVSTVHGLFVAVANPFGPRVAVNRDGQWGYEDNPRGGCEIWLGRKPTPVA